MAFFVNIIGWVVAKLFSDNVLKFVAGKAMLTFLFVVVLPIVLNNFIYDLLQMFMQFTVNSVDSGNYDGTIQLTGFASWLCNCFRVSECISVIVGALCLRAVLNYIPFVRI